MSKKIERLMNLIALLSDTKVPRTLHEIITTVPGYSDNFDAARRNFERDKEELRSMGFDVIIEENPYGENGYRIKKESAFYDVELTSKQRNILQYALQIYGPDQQSAQQSISKLGGSDSTDQLMVSPLKMPELVSELSTACAQEKPIEIKFKDEKRSVLPKRIIARNGYWYLETFDLDKNEKRTFRIDRINSVNTEIDKEFHVEGIAEPEHEEKYLVTLKVHPMLKEQVKNSFGAQFDESSDITQIEISRLELIKPVIIDYLGYVEVLDPENLKNELLENIDEAIEQLEKI